MKSSRFHDHTIYSSLTYRQRQLDKFLALGADAFSDNELLELLLFFSKSRKSTKLLVEKLVSKYGSILAILTASPYSLKQVHGVTDNIIQLFKLIHGIFGRALQQELKGKPVIQSWQQLIDYCKVTMSHIATEQLRLLFLDQRNQLIGDEIQQVGTINRTSVYPREVMKRALEVGAASIIMVHNHPSGDPVPSRADIDITLKIQRIGRELEITLHDHVVIGQGQYRSFKTMGIL